MRIALIFIGLLVWTSANGDESVQWMWKCNQSAHRCNRVNALGTSPPPTYFNTLPLCRLTCGKYGGLWPRPTGSTTLGNDLIPIYIEAIAFELNAPENLKRLLENVTGLFLQDLQSQCEDGGCATSYDTKIFIQIHVNSSRADLKWGTDESYTLKTTSKDNTALVAITATTVFGARHALETLLQLTAVAEFQETNRAIVKGLVMMATVTIEDRPVYTHRGLLIDTARNYLPLPAIRRQIDAMAASKLNTLHWHMTDSQSFPFQSTRVPQLSRYGAYSPDQVYTADSLREMVQYAKTRGVRVIIEIDSPSHAGSGWQWGREAGLDDLVVCYAQQPWRNYCIQPPCGQLNPINQHVYEVLENLYRDVLEVVGAGEVMHMGGDEVFIPCWNASEAIRNYLQQALKPLTTESFLELWGVFQEKAKRAFDAAAGRDDTPIMLWTSALTDPLYIEKYLANNRYVIQTWVPSSNPLPAQLLDKGYRIVVSTKDAWYLDHGFWGRTKYYTWHTVYNNRIRRDAGVLGGEVCMWGEYVDGSTIDGKVWPRAAAFAERMWSDPDTSTYEVEGRFYGHRERLVQKGVDADAITPYWCYQNEGMCN